MRYRRFEKQDTVPCRIELLSRAEGRTSLQPNLSEPVWNPRGGRAIERTSNGHLFPLKARIRVLTGVNTARVFIARREAVLSSSLHRTRRNLPSFTIPESVTVSIFAGLSVCSPNFLGCGGIQEGMSVISGGIPVYA